MVRPNESELIVPLRNAWNITRYKRAPRAMQIIREQVIRHLKVREDEELYIDPEVNEHIWKRGIENPPPPRARSMSARQSAPEISRSAANDDGPIAPLASAARLSSELAAKATMTTIINKKSRTRKSFCQMRLVLPQEQGKKIGPSAGWTLKFISNS